MAGRRQAVIIYTAYPPVRRRGVLFDVLCFFSCIRFSALSASLDFVLAATTQFQLCC